MNFYIWICLISVKFKSIFRCAYNYNTKWRKEDQKEAISRCERVPLNGIKWSCGLISNDAKHINQSCRFCFTAFYTRFADEYNTQWRTTEHKKYQIFNCAQCIFQHNSIDAAIGCQLVSFSNIFLFLCGLWSHWWACVFACVCFQMCSVTFAGVCVHVCIRVCAFDLMPHNHLDVTSAEWNWK